MQRLEVSGAVRHIYASLGFKGLIGYRDSFAFYLTQCRIMLRLDLSFV